MPWEAETDDEGVVGDPDAVDYLDEEGTTRYPNLEVQLLGSDGNAFMIIGKVGRAMRRAKIPTTEIDKFTTEATSGDYDHVLVTCMRWVNVQ